MGEISPSVGKRLKAHAIASVSGLTSRYKPVGHLIVGERDQFVNWKVSEVGDSDQPWLKVAGDPEAGLLRSRWRTAVVLGGVSVGELTREGVPAVAIDLGGIVLAGEFDPAAGKEQSRPSDRVEVALAIGPDDMMVTLGQLMPNGPFRPNVKTARLNHPFGQNQGSPIADLREGSGLFPEAILL